LRARITGIAEWSAQHPGDMRTLEDVERLCDSTILYTAGAVDTVAFVAGTFAVAASAHTAGISFVHFFALCYVLGDLASLCNGAAELYGVTSWLTHQGCPDRAQEAIGLCAKPRSRRANRMGAVSDASDEEAPGPEVEQDDPAPTGDAAKQLAWRWAKLSVAAGLPVLHDRYMTRESQSLIEQLRSAR